MSTTTARAAVREESTQDPDEQRAGDPETGGRRPLRRRLFPLLLAAVVLLAVVALAVGHASSSVTPLAPDNPRPEGAQAVATLLEREGVRVRTARTTAEALALAGPNTTLLVTEGRHLDDAQLAAVRDTGADLVLSRVTYLPDLEPLTADVEPSAVGSPDQLRADCSAPPAVAAGEISHSTGGLRVLSPDVEACFPTGTDTAALATWQDGERQVAVLADGGLMSNEHLAESGNAALTLWLLGGHEDLIWYLPTVGDTVATEADDDDALGLLPPGATAIGWQLLVVAAVLLLWGARRLGPVVTEAMPVVVRSSETTLGRGRLYRRGRAHAHAAAGMRAGFAARTARLLGLPRSAPPGTLVTAVAAATGRDELLVERLLYGPPPSGDTELITLTRELDILESEVHRT